MKFDWPIDKTWTLFLDRDDVINKRRIDDYVKSWGEFEFLDGALQALAILNRHFSRIVIVSNQQGVGKGIMTQGDLDTIHEHMCQEIRLQGGDIHAVYTATALQEHDTESTRKPGLWMAHCAQKDFPQIDFTKSIMVGDSMSDMRFGRNAGMVTVLIGTSPHVGTAEAELVDACYPSLIACAQAIESSL